MNKNYNLPFHIAFIMDGNGRWAEKQKKPRIFGHKQGIFTMKNIIKYAYNFKFIKVLTFFIFSTENWKRSKIEVNFILKLPIFFFKIFINDLMKYNMKVNFIGNIKKIPLETQKIINKVIKKTYKNTGITLVFAINYGGRNEIINLTKKIFNKYKKKNINFINENTISDYLETNFLNKKFQFPDLVIRTGGEKRISNFLLWQIAYSEFYFLDVFWPDFNKFLFKKIILNFKRRIRKFGNVKK